MRTLIALLFLSSLLQGHREFAFSTVELRVAPDSIFMANEGGGFGFQSGRIVETCSRSGKRLVMSKIPAGHLCLSHSKETGFVSLATPRITWESGRRGALAPYLNVFASQSSLFYQSLGTTFVGDFKKGYLDAMFGRYSALALNRENTKLAFMSDDPAQPGLYIFELNSDNGKLSLSDQKPVVPRIANVGTCLVQPLRNDMVFLDSKRVLYSAEVFPGIDKMEFEKWSQGVPAVLEASRDKGRRLTNNYIVVTDIETGDSSVIGKILAYKPSEPGSPQHGTLTTSADGASIFLLFGNKVLCIQSNTSAVLRNRLQRMQ